MVPTSVLLLSVLVFIFGVQCAKNKIPSEEQEKGGSEIIPSLTSRYTSPTASSYYGYHSMANPTLSPNPYRHSYMFNPLLADPYERVGREYASASSNIGYAASAPDLMTAAGGHGGGSHHGGGGGGGGGGYGGHGHDHGHYTKVSNTGLGLLGLLGLLSLLQGVLNAIAASATTAAPAATTAAGTLYDYTDYTFRGKTKRSIKDAAHQPESMSDRITRLVLPSLNVVAHARDGSIPLDCTHHEVCLANNIIINELGEDGRLVGHRLSGAIGRLLHEVDGKGEILHSLDLATKAGQKGLNCHTAYPVCRAMLKPDGTINYPPIMMPLKDLQSRASMIRTL